MTKLLCLIGFTSISIVNAATNAPVAKPEPDLGAMFKMHWENRVRAFKEQNLAWQNVVLLGDSITEGFDVTKYCPGRRVSRDEGRLLASAACRKRRLRR